MTWLVQPRLINGPFDDPGLFVDFRFSRRALLFDLGDVHALSAREIMRVSHVFVSHGHMDHFAGFDRLLRICLHRPAPLHLVGPPGMIELVGHRFGSYTWNLLGKDSVDFTVIVAEFDGERLARACEFRARDAFRPREAAPSDTGPGVVLQEDALQVDSVMLDHGIPCLAFALRETARLNVCKEGLARLGLPVGPWLNEAKRAVRRNAPDDTPIEVSPEVSVPLGAFREHVLRIGPGQTIAYVVDAAYHEGNIARILELARGADQLFIEAAFLDEDAALGANRRHLTAGQAGRLARSAGVRRLVPLHFSPRYLDREDVLRREVQEAFAGELP